MELLCSLENAPIGNLRLSRAVSICSPVFKAARRQVVRLPPGLATVGGWGLFFHRGRARLSRFDTVANHRRSNFGFFVFSGNAFGSKSVAITTKV